jgi:hypothetical protein
MGLLGTLGGLLELQKEISLLMFPLDGAILIQINRTIIPSTNVFLKVSFLIILSSLRYLIICRVYKCFI